MLIFRECSRCMMMKQLTEENYVRSHRAGCEWFAVCRACQAEEPPPTRKQARCKAEEAADREARIRREAEREIVLLIRRYEAVRFAPGRDRSSAYNALSVALQRHGRCVGDGIREWEWSPALGEITTRLIRRQWTPPEDRHADPRHVARDDLIAAGIDLVEIP